MKKERQSPRNDFDTTTKKIEYYFEKGWTDGLPVIPPTGGLIRAALKGAGLHPEDEIAFIEHRNVSVTAEKVAINAVMAGCKPEYMPVVTATIRAIADPAWSYHGPATSTGGAAVFMLVNGPIARKLGINSGDNLFGPGWRANATIGRAVRLIMRNVIGTLPGQLDRSTLGHGGKYTYCIAENEEASPWPSVHVERGFRPEQNTVTVLAALAPHQFYDQLSNSAVGVLTTACAQMRLSSGISSQPEYVLIISGEHREIIVRDGWSKNDIRQFCFEHTKSPIAELKRIHAIPGEVQPEDENMLRSLVSSPEDFIVVAAGGEAGAFSCYIPAWSSKRTSQSVTKEILQP